VVHFATLYVNLAPSPEILRRFFRTTTSLEPLFIMITSQRKIKTNWPGLLFIPIIPLLALTAILALAFKASSVSIYHHETNGGLVIAYTHLFPNDEHQVAEYPETVGNGVAPLLYISAIFNLAIALWMGFITFRALCKAHPFRVRVSSLI
jgi:hypothetical protein